MGTVDPAWTLRDIYGDVVFNPVMSFRAPGWLPDREAMQARTGGLISVAGDVPLICHTHTATDRALDLLRRAGLPVASELLTYDSQSDYEALVRNVPAKRMAIHYAHRKGELDDSRLWISHQLLRYLNNKENIAALAPHETLARRRVIPAADLFDPALEGELPFVVKAATDLASGGGVGVRVCTDVHELNHARDVFGKTEKVVVEEFVAIERNLCVQFLALHGGGIEHLGIAEQVSAPNGQYQGNWLYSKEHCPPAVAVGRAIIETAAAMGYVGVAGFDMAVDSRGKVVVIDLNFRFNGSTVPLLLQRSLGADWMRFKAWTADSIQTGPFLAAARAAVDRGIFVPMCVYDPDPAPERSVWMNGVVVGGTRAEVVSRDEELSGALTCFPSGGGD